MPGWELLGDEEKQALSDVFDNSGGVLYRYGLDALRNNIFRVDQFEKEIAKKVGAEYALCVSSGTAALKLALIGLGVKRGDEVITQSFTFIATVEAILELGAVPVISEVDESLNMDPIDLEKKITYKTKVIIPVHMGGVSAKMDEIMAIAKKKGISVLEDSAQALGATYKGKPLGMIGDAGIYSLDIGKIITTGEGGLLVTDNDHIYLTAREYSDHGHEQNPSVPRGEDTRKIWGFNYKVTELHGAIGLAQLKKLDHILQKQKENKRKIKKGIMGLPGITFREIPDEEGDASDTLIFFLESRDKAKEFAKLLLEQGIGTKNLPDAINWHFAGTWDHIFEGMEEYKGKNWKENVKMSEDLLRRSIAIGMLVKMEDDMINKIINSITDIAKRIDQHG